MSWVGGLNLSPSLRFPFAREEEPYEVPVGAKQHTVSNFSPFILVLFTSRTSHVGKMLASLKFFY